MLKPQVIPASIWRIQSWEVPESAPTALETAFQLQWPLETGSVATGRVSVLCTGPTDWLLVCAEPYPDAQMKKLSASWAETPYRATDLSQGLIRLEISGPKIRPLLNKGSSLDLALEEFAVQRCTRTRLAGIPVILWCRQPDQFACLLAAGYASYLLSWITDASLEFQAVAR